jgi:hypothetical protein
MVNRTLVRAVATIVIVASVVWAPSALALPRDPGDQGGGGGGGGGGGTSDYWTRCVDDTSISFNASPQKVDQNASSALTWSVVRPAHCTTILKQLFLNGQEVGFTGSRVVTPGTSSARYTLSISTPVGRQPLVDLPVEVKLPSVVDIKDSGPLWRNLLVQALSTEYATVRLWPNVDMDLSDLEEIFIAEGVTLVGGKPCDPEHAPPASLAPPVFDVTLCGGRDPHHLGPRLRTTTRPKPLFLARCNDGGFRGNNVRISGFRLQGPHFESVDGDDNKEVGIRINNCTGIDISNMEMWGWSGAAISIWEDTPPRLTHPDQVKIHDNYIHHNQHYGGYGYGVDVGVGAWASIERNVFDFNRHAITASGSPGTGYRAHQNLVLRGGGVHGSAVNAYTQQFDVHGDRNCPDTPWTSSLWNCGRAGHEFWITNNAFQYQLDHAIKIRGQPTIAVHINNNVFAQAHGDAVEQNGTGAIGGTGPLANTFEADTYGDYGACDFDGDGRDDLFLATGASWWYMSSARSSWTYLNSHPERINQVALGKFDSDSRCDVFAVRGNDWVISTGGAGTWNPIARYGVPFDQLAFGDFNADGITDVFRRAPDGQWSVVSPGVYPWAAVQSSKLPLSQLRFGDFTGDGVTDVLAVESGHWSISRSARGGWEPWNPSLSDSLARVLIADLDGDRKADVVRYTATSPIRGTWEVSRDGRTGWQELASMSWPEIWREHSPSARVRGYVGRFSAPLGGQDLLSPDVLTRQGRLLNKAAKSFDFYSPYAF